MGKHKGHSSHRIDHRGHFSTLPHEVFDSPAYQDCSLRARCILSGLLRRFNGYNNGRIAYSVRQMAQDLAGCSTRAPDHRPISRAVAELMEHGLIDCTADFRRGERMAREYRLTFASSGSDRAPEPATHDYRHWRPKGNFGGVIGTPDEGKPAVSGTPEGKLSAVVKLPGATETCGVSPVSPAGERTPHIFAIVSQSGDPETDQGKLSGKHCAANLRPADPHDPIRESDDLREWVLSQIDDLPGAQTRLARASSVPGGTMSKFLHRGRNLTRSHRIAIHAALPAVVSTLKKEAARR